jgi:putative endonuclease
MWHVYVLRSKNGSLYTGVATDVDRRLAEHEKARGKGAKSLRGRGPLRLAYRRSVGSRALALRVEHGIKRLSKIEKEQLVEANPDTGGLLEMLAIQRIAGA